MTKDMTSMGYRLSFGQGMRLLLGLFGFALGVVMTLRASLGISPWDVLHDGLALQTPLTFGTAVIVVGLVLLLLSLMAGIKPGPGTIANMLLIGVFADLLLATGVGAGLHDGAIAIRLPLLLAGVVIVGLGSALYIGAELGAGPRDSLMVAVATRFNMRVGVARAIVEGSALVAGILLGGQVGVGTVIFAVAIGPSVDVSFRLFGMDSSGRTVKQSAVEATY
ncbi:MAG: YczE/YyaS/YitT family protein [Actinomycetota bacterium]